MKRIVIILLLAALICSLSACLSHEYLSVHEHVDPFSYKESTVAETEEQPLSASDYYSLRSIVLSLMTEGTEHAQIELNGYSGTPESDLRRVADYLTKADPVGAFAIDYINYEYNSESGRKFVDYDIVYRRSAGEIAAIRSVRGNEQADSVIYSALEEFAPSVTLQISGYTDEDFEQTVRDYCLQHPDKTVLCSQVSVAVYPETGNVRVAEFHFVYDLTKEELRSMLSDTATVLTSAYNYIRYGQTQEDCATLALSYLVGRFPYRDNERATPYTLLCQGVSNSTAFSAVYAYLCNTDEIPALIVRGTKDEQPYDWTMLQIGDMWYHFDVAQTVMDESRVLALKTDDEMEGYEWDVEAYPSSERIPDETELPDEND